MTRTFLILAAVFGATGVALGAFGAHWLNAFFVANPAQETSYHTAVLYHQLHALALLGAAFVSYIAPSRWARLAGWAFAIGILLFSGSLYLLSFANLRIMGVVAPVGGLAFIFGWACIGAAAWQMPRLPPGNSNG